ncbi:MAG: hypothetical protein GY810_04365 [Aureispira sp.]|nr:hypothetical protein [Aureispira sp.]
MLPNKDFFDFKVYPMPNLNDKHQLQLSGENAKKTLVLCKTINTDLGAFLSKILSAVKYNMEKDVALYNGASLPFLPSFVQFKKTIDFDNLLCFGYAPKDLGLHIQVAAYQKTAWQDHQLLFSHDLPNIMDNQQQKKALWVALQQMF